MSNDTTARPASRRSDLPTTTVPLPDWFILLVLVLLVASEYKFRRRTLGDSLGGSLDFMVMLEIGVYGLVALTMAVQHFKGGRPPRPTPLMVALWTYGAIMAASTLYAPFMNLAVVRGGQLLIIVAFTQMLADRADQMQFRRFSQYYVGLMMVSIGVGLVYVAPTSRYQAGRFTWLHVHSVSAGAMLSSGLILAVGLLAIRPPGAGRQRWVTLVLVGCTAAVAGALVMSKTRGSIGGAVAGLLVFAVLRVPRQRRAGAVVLGGAGLAGLLYFALPAVESFVARGEPPESITTLSNRTELWSIAWTDIQRKPVFGWGMTASRGLFFDAVQLGGAHNAFVNAAVDGGLVGFTAWAVLLVLLVVTMWQTWKRFPSTHPQVALCAGVFVALVVNGVTMEGLGSGAGIAFLMLCILIAWVLTLGRTAEELQGPPSGPGRRAAGVVAAPRDQNPIGS